MEKAQYFDLEGGTQRLTSLCASLHIYLHSVCFPILSLCSLIMLFCIFSVNCCLYYSGYLIVSKLSHLTAHLLLHVFTGTLHVRAQGRGEGSTQEVRQKYKYVPICQLFGFQMLHQQTPVVRPYSERQFPKAKETRIRKEAGPQMAQRKAAEVRRHLHSCPSLAFPAARRER